MWAVWAAVLMTYGAVLETAKNSADDAFTAHLWLNMAPDAIDDMYDGCRDEMMDKVKKEYLVNEKNQNRNFSVAWDEAKKFYNKLWKHKRGNKASSPLGKHQIMAIYVYTLDEPKIYLDFNNAVRSQKAKYKTTFRYHALHFFLTDALQTLNVRKPKAERCLIGFRRVDGYFNQDIVNKVIRFGSFTSTSMGWYSRPEKYGGKTCLEIFTCFGADISLYSKHGESEREVLIPPFEIFKVTKVTKRSDRMRLPCEVVYTLKTTGNTLSTLNCALF